MAQQIIKLNGLSSEEQQLVNEIMTFIDNNEKDDLLEIQQWIDRCKADVILSAPRFDGHDINSWVDFEDLYRKQGWKVVYDKPAYCETYKAYFVLSKKK